MTEKEFAEEIKKRKLYCEFERIDMTRNYNVTVWKDNDMRRINKELSFEFGADEFNIGLELKKLLNEIDETFSH